MQKTKNIFISSGLLLGIGASALVAPTANASPVSITPEASKAVSLVNVTASKKVAVSKTGKTTENLNMRSGNSTKHRVIKVLKKGSTVTILDSKSGWYKVKSGNHSGWVSAKYISNVKTHKKTTQTKTKTTSPKTSTASTQKQVTANLNMRSSGSVKSRVIKVLKKGSKVTVKRTANGWAQITHGKQTGWVSAKYLTRVATYKSKSATPKSSSTNTVRTKIINNAKKHVGAPYRFGGTSPKTGWDCSGYVQYVFKESGIKAPRTKAWVGKKKISKTQAKPGDLVVQYGGGHVGIYSGNGKQYHASNPTTDTVHSKIWDKKAVYYSIG